MAMRKRQSLILLLSALLVIAFIRVREVLKHSVVTQAASYYQGVGTRRMAQRLEEIATNANPGLVVSKGIMAAQLRDLLRQSQDIKKQVNLQGTLGRVLLQDGKTSEAITEFKELQKKLAGLPVPPTPSLRAMIRDWLALSYLRLGEQENCVMHHGIDSCLLPIRGNGIHTQQRGSRLAIEEYKSLLNEFPADLTYRWLLNIAYMTVGEYPDKVPPRWLIPPKVFESDYDIKRFFDIAPDLGIAVQGLAGGVVMEDFDGDGYLDLMVSAWGLRDQLRLFRNNGDGTFADRTNEAGLKGTVGGLNLCHADYNNDGYPDVLVLRGAWFRKDGHHPNSLLRNNGNGTFDDVTEQAGLLSFHPTQTASWGDYDNDGWLDLFIGNESVNGDENRCELFHNNGNGTFTECAGLMGIDTIGFVKGVAWGDYNNDGRLDLYVSRLGESNILFRNDGMKTTGTSNETGKKPDSFRQKSQVRPWIFTDASKQAGVEEPRYSFPTWFFDYDNDGWLDLYVGATDYVGAIAFGPDVQKSVVGVASSYLGLPNESELPRLYRNNQDGTFTDVTKSSRLDKVLLAMAGNFGDLDNDGFLDFYVGTGAPDLRTLVPNRMFRNAGGGFFQDVTTSGGFGHLQKGHGIAFGDLDNDGDQDIYEVMGGAYPGDVSQNVMFSNPGHGNHWITLKLEGNGSNRSGIGTKVRIRVKTKSGGRDIYVTVCTGGSFGSSSLQQEIGLGDAIAIEFIQIAWPTTGQTQVFKNVTMDQILKIREGDTKPVRVSLKRIDFASAGKH
jgi:FG-GAP-like repeat/ASPIC and UnbV